MRIKYMCVRRTLNVCCIRSANHHEAKKCNRQQRYRQPAHEKWQTLFRSNVDWLSVRIGTHFCDWNIVSNGIIFITQSTPKMFTVAFLPSFGCASHLDVLYGLLTLLFSIRFEHFFRLSFLCFSLFYLQIVQNDTEREVLMWHQRQQYDKLKRREQRT